MPGTLTLEGSFLSVLKRVSPTSTRQTRRNDEQVVGELESSHPDHDIVESELRFDYK
jgi:hypothetical protein